MKIYIALFLLINFTTMLAQSDTTEVKKNKIENVSGTWIIDLRPTPESDPYLKEFRMKYEADNNFSGIFYDTEFKDGKLNGNWEYIYFAFTTSDNSSSYYHSGYFDGDKIKGITYSPERNFTMPWRGKKK